MSYSNRFFLYLFGCFLMGLATGAESPKIGSAAAVATLICMGIAALAPSHD